jgi:putative transposase
MARLPRLDFPGIAQHIVQRGEVGAVSRMMQAIGRRYVGCFNARYRRTGTLWEGRFKSALVDSDDYLLTCYRYIELNPVRARMVPAPADYRWSSHARNAHGTHEPRITSHPLYLGLGASDAKRQQAYRELFKAELRSNELNDLRAHTRKRKATMQRTASRVRGKSTT